MILTAKGRLLILLPLVCVCCQVAASQVVDTPRGRLEFVGLERWDIATIEQRLGYESLEKAICSVRHDLTDKLRFADAFCTSYVENGRPYKVITVLEPQDVARISYRLEPEEHLETPLAWRELLHIVDEQTFLNTILDYGSKLDHAAAVETLLAEEDESWFALLQSRTSEEDFHLALAHLTSDGDYKNRVISAMILMNFGYRDASWQALTAGLRDPNEMVRTVCSQSLLSLVRYTPRTVDWSPAVPDLNALLSGTSLFAYSWVVDVLVQTRVSPRLARPLLKGKACELLLAYLNAAHDRERDLAHNLLTRLSGKDFGYDSDLWREWITSGTITPTRTLLARHDSPPVTPRAKLRLRHSLALL